MRIGYVTYGLDRSPTGIGRYSLELLRAMTRVPEGPEIVVLATEKADTHGLRDLCEYHAVPGLSALPALLTLGSAVIPQLARRYHLDAIHDPNGIAPFLGLRRSAKLILTIHDACPYVHPETHNWLDNWRYRWHLPYAARRADMVTTVSQSSRRDLISYLKLQPENVMVTTEGVDERFKPQTDPQRQLNVLMRYGIRTPYVLYVGALNGRKNVARLLEAFDRIRARHGDVTLVIGGQRQWKAGEIDRTMQRLELASSVVFTGYIDDESLPVLYSAARAFVFPSLYEGFGLPVIEAMSCGAPVITSKVSSLPEVAGDAAILIEPTDVDALAGAIDRVLTDHRLRRELSVRGLRRAAHFTWRTAAREMLDAYQQALGNAFPTVDTDRPGSPEELRRAV